MLKKLDRLEEVVAVIVLSGTVLAVLVGAIGRAVGHPYPAAPEVAQLLLGDAAHPMYPVGSNGASQAILDAPREGCLNVHGSILPRWMTRMRAIRCRRPRGCGRCRSRRPAMRPSA